MKKRVITLILLIIVLLVYVCFAVGCMLFPRVDPMETIPRPKYVEYFDQNKKIYFRTVGGYDGFGYLTLNGKKIPARYSLDVYSGYEEYIKISIPKEEDLRIDVEPTNRTYVSTLVRIRNLYEQNQVAFQKKVELFGESFEKVVLTVNQLEKADFEPWEYQFRWESKISEEWKVLDFVGTEEVFNGHKCLRVHARKTEQDKAQACIFKWLPDTKGFEIYFVEYQSQTTPTEGQQPIATGTYVLQDEVVTLTFVTDGVFDGAYPTLELTLRY